MGRDVRLNGGRLPAVANRGGRPIPVGPHYRFCETNEALAFDRHLSAAVFPLADLAIIVHNTRRTSTGGAMPRPSRRDPTDLLAAAESGN